MFDWLHLNKLEMELVDFQKSEVWTQNLSADIISKGSKIISLSNKRKQILRKHS